MKRFIIALSMIFIFPLTIFAWTDTGGSTVTATGGEGWEMKDIQNDVHDIPHSAWSVYNISSGPYHTQNWIWNGNDWIKWEGSFSNYDNHTVSSYTIGAKVFLYGFDGTSWDRLRSDEVMDLRTRTSTNSVVGIYKDGNVAWVLKGTSDTVNSQGLDALLVDCQLFGYNGSTWDRLRSDTDNILKVRTATGSVISNILNPVTSYITLSQFVEISKNATSYSYLSTEQYNELRGHATSFLTLSQFIELSMNATSYICGGKLDELYRLLEGTITLRGGYIDQILKLSSCVVQNFPTDYPDSTAQSSLSSIDTNTLNTYNQLKSSVIVCNIDYSGKVSTGTAGKVLVSGNIAITNWNMDSYTFYSIGGDTEITSTFMGGIIYAIDGIAVAPIKLSKPIVNPTFQCLMNYGTTLYYVLNGIGN